MSASNSHDQIDTAAPLLYTDLFLLHLPWCRICCHKFLSELGNLIQTHEEAPYVSHLINCFNSVNKLNSLGPHGHCNLFSSRILYTAKHLLRGFYIKEAYMVHFINP